MKRLTVLLSLLTMVVTSPSAAQSAADPKARGDALLVAKADESAVRETVNAYLHGLKFNDVASLKKAFWPEAKLFFVGRDGKLGELTQENWYKGFVANAGKEEPGDLRITSVEVTNNAASVKVVEDYPGKPGTRYTDYISLLKLSGKWWIVNKIYTVEPLK